MTWPSTVSTFTNPNATDKLNAPSHSSIETAQNTGLTELQTFIGTLSSAAGTLMYDVRSSNSDGGGHVQAVNKGGTGLTSYSKGNLLVATSQSVLAKLAVGTDGQVLQADSTQQSGVGWATATFAAGMIIQWATPTAPTGWLNCDGGAYPISSYATLYSVIGSIYGANFTTSVFNVPNFSSRVPIGIGSSLGGGFTGRGSVAGGSVLGSVVAGYWTGEETHLLTGAESGLPSHTHTLTGSNSSSNNNTRVAEGTNTTDQTVTTGAAGPTNASSAHNIMQPVLGINFIIKT